MSVLARSIRMSSPSRASSASSIAAASRLSNVHRHLSGTPAMSKSKELAVPKPASPEEVVLYDNMGTARVYKLNRPKALNSLNQEMIDSLTTRINTWNESEVAKLIIGRGDQRAFCAGGDVKQLVLDIEAGKNTSLGFFEKEFALNWRMGRLDKPYISIMDGITMGGGCGIALPAPFRIATPRTHFAMPETKIGYSPDVGVSYYLAQLDGQIGTWLAITGQDIFGRAVYELGLATHYIHHDTIDEVIAQVSQLEDASPEIINKLLAEYSLALPPPTPTSSKQTPDGPTPITGDIRTFLDYAFGFDDIASVRNALKEGETSEKYPEAVRTWAKEQGEIIDFRSPTGMAVALEAVRRSRASKRLSQTLDDDMTMATALTRASQDFITGVTAVLITRTKERPDWSPNSVYSKSLKPTSILAKYFTKDREFTKDVPTLDTEPSTPNYRQYRPKEWYEGIPGPVLEPVRERIYETIASSQDLADADARARARASEKAAEVKPEPVPDAEVTEAETETAAASEEVAEPVPEPVSESEETVTASEEAVTTTEEAVTKTEEVSKSVAEPESPPEEVAKIAVVPPKPIQRPVSDPDSTWGKFRKYGLPSELEVQDIVTGASPDSGAFKVTEEELVEHLLGSRGENAGPRDFEIKQRARALVKRVCKVSSEGYLDPKRS